jgi:hypothetical protein
MNRRQDPAWIETDFTEKQFLMLFYWRRVWNRPRGGLKDIIQCILSKSDRLHESQWNWTALQWIIRLRLFGIWNRAVFCKVTVFTHEKKLVRTRHTTPIRCKNTLSYISRTNVLFRKSMQIFRSSKRIIYDWLQTFLQRKYNGLVFSILSLSVCVGKWMFRNNLECEYMTFLCKIYKYNN